MSVAGSVTAEAKRVSSAATVTFENRSVITGCAAGHVSMSPRPVVVLPISNRETRTSSVVSVVSHPRRSSASSVTLSSADRRRTSSVVSVAYPRKETWASIQTPDSHWYPAGVSGLSFGLPQPSGPVQPAVEAWEQAASAEALPARRRASSVGTRVSSAAPAGLLVQAQLPALPPPPRYPAPLTSLPSSMAPPPPAALPQHQAAPPSCGVTVAAGQPLASIAMVVPGQAVQMPYGSYFQAPPASAYVYVGVVPTQMQPHAALQPQAQPLKLASLLAEGVSSAATISGTAAQGFGSQQHAVTTVMLRNIPQKYDRESLLEVLNQSGFRGSFDFFYLPIDFSTTNSVGYAFINFVNEAELARFRAAYVGLKLSEDSPKVCEVCDAKLQGREKNVDFYRNSTVMGMDEKYHPVLFEHGVRVPFPKPTRPLGPVQRRPPRTQFRQ